MGIAGRVGLWFAHLHIVQIDSAFSSCIKEKLRVHFIQQDVHGDSASSSIQHFKQQIHVSENVHDYGYHLGKEHREVLRDLCLPAAALLVFPSTQHSKAALLNGLHFDFLFSGLQNWK